MNCKECKYFENTKPADAIKSEKDKRKVSDFYIGMCKNIGRIKMMNDVCQLFERKESK